MDILSTDLLQILRFGHHGPSVMPLVGMANNPETEPVQEAPVRDLYSSIKHAIM